MCAREVDLVLDETHRKGSPAASATMAKASSGLVRKITLAASRRGRSVAHSSGRNSRRSSRVWPRAACYPRNTPPWQFARLLERARIPSGDSLRRMNRPEVRSGNGRSVW